MILTPIVFSAIAECSPAMPFRLRTDIQGMISISSGDPDHSASVIRGSDLIPIAKMRAFDVLRESRACGCQLVEDVGIAGDGGVVLEFAGQDGRELMIAIPASGSWTYFSASVEGRQIKAGILRDDGIPLPIRWVAGSQSDLSGPGIVAG